VHYASERGHEKVVILLLEHGGEIKITHDGLSPVHMAKNSNIKSELEATQLMNQINSLTFK